MDPIAGFVLPPVTLATLWLIGFLARQARSELGQGWRLWASVAGAYVAVLLATVLWAGLHRPG